MVFKFHMQHDQTAGCQNQIQPGGESKVPLLEIAKLTKSTGLQNPLVYFSEILHTASV